MFSSRFVLFLMLAAATSPLVAQVPNDDPVEAQAKWYDRQKERPDLVKGAFEVLRFPTGWKFEPRYEHDPANRKLIRNPDFYCNRCLREKRIAARIGSTGPKVPSSTKETDPGLGSDKRLMDRDEDQVLSGISRITRATNFIHIEDPDFKLIFDLDGINLKIFHNPFLAEELQQLGDIFPEVTEKTVDIDGHKRAHLYLIRAHRILRDFWWLAGTNQEKFRQEHKYLGPFLGMNGKQQLYVFDKQQDYDTFATQFIGRTSTDGQCWHNFNERAMAMLMAGCGHEEPRVLNKYIHRLTHNLTDAYRMYAYKVPAWFQVGIAAWMERRENTRFNTFCFSEGTLPNVLLQKLTDDKWLPKIKKLVLSEKVEPFVSICPVQEYGELKPEYHMVSYSWFCFALRLGPEKFPIFFNALKSKQPTETLYQSQVKAFKEAYGLTMLQFDEAWKAWVRDVYPDL